MSTTCLKPHHLEAALSRLTSPARRTHPARWEFALAEGGPVVDVVAEEETASLMCVLGAGEGPTGRGGDDGVREELLSWNATLRGHAKFSIVNRADLTLGAEVLVLPGEAGFQRLGAAVEGIRQGWGQWRDRTQGGEPLLAGRGEAPAGAGVPALDGLGELSGWPCTPRGDGALVFDLEGIGLRFPHAVLEGRPAGEVCLSVKLGEWGALEETVRAALGLFLLRLNGLMRTPRAALVKADESVEARIEVAWDCRPGGEDLLFGLEGLNVASRHFGREIESLFSAALAEQYLEVGLGVCP